MRYNVAWSKVVSENNLLKVVILALLVASVFESSAVVTLSGRKPLVVERSCTSKALTPVSTERTNSEIESFIKEALSQRFDTAKSVIPSFISPDEERFRVQEQAELKKREIAERIFVNSVSVDGSSISVDSDRFFSMGNVKSVVSFPLKLVLATISRSDANPYGLSIVRVSASKGSTQNGAQEGEKK